MSNNGFFIISAILGLGIPAIVVISSVILFIVKIIERIKEKTSSISNTPPFLHLSGGGSLLIIA